MLPNFKKNIGINLRFFNWYFFLLIASLSCIAVATLSPWNFLIPKSLSLSSLVKEFTFGSNLKDYWQNILLFVTWGFSFCAVVTPKIKRAWLILIISFLGSACLSSFIESTQLFLPSRVSNFTDIICNSFGGCIGGIIYYYRWNIIKFISNIIRRDFDRLSYKSILLVMAGYCSIILFGILMLSINVNLDNWSNNYHLAVGNEVTANRPWNGYLRSLYISDRALQDSEISSVFANPKNFFEQDINSVAKIDIDRDNSILSNLEWNTRPKLKQNKEENRVRSLISNNALDLSNKQWLKTKLRATSLANSLKKADEFSISLNVATKDINQSGPGRLFSLSKGTYAQNLMVGQNRTDLFFRLRTSLTKQSPAHPEFIVPGVFRDRDFHQILITFAEKELIFYIDEYQNKYSFVFNPNSIFILFAPWNNKQWQIDLGNFSLFKHQLCFYTIIGTPLLLLAAILILKSLGFRV